MSPRSDDGAVALPRVPRLLDLARAMEGAEVAVFADLVADRFISGTPSRVSREAPVVILEREADRFVAGGGANAAANVAALGGRAHLFGAVGDDRSGRVLLDALLKCGVSSDQVLVLDGHETPTKTRILGGFGTNKQQIVRIDSGRSLDPDALRSEQFTRALREHLGQRVALRNAPVLLVSDYGYGTIEPTSLRSLRAALPTCRMMVDSRHRLSSFPGATVATPNQEEAETLIGSSLDSEQSLLRHGPQLRQRLQTEVLLITRGSQGMALFLGDRCLLVPVYGTDEVRDVTGAGDTVIGTLSLAFAAGAQPAEAAVLANFAGGIVVLKAGTATVKPAELRAAIGTAEHFLEELRWVEY